VSYFISAFGLFRRNRRPQSNIDFSSYIKALGGKSLGEFDTERRDAFDREVVDTVDYLNSDAVWKQTLENDYLALGLTPGTALDGQHQARKELAVGNIASYGIVDTEFAVKACAIARWIETMNEEDIKIRGYPLGPDPVDVLNMLAHSRQHRKT